MPGSGFPEDFPPPTGGGGHFVPVGAPYGVLDVNEGVTPYRKSRLSFLVPEYRVVRRPFAQQFSGGGLANPKGLALVFGNQAENLNHVGVQRLPSGSWCQKSWEMQYNFERNDLQRLPGFNDFPAPLLAPNSGSLPVPVRVPAGPDGQAPAYTGDVVPPGSSGAPFFRGRRPKGAPWGQETSTDFPAKVPLAPNPNTPMRRLLQTAKSFGTNAGVFLRFVGPAGLLQSADYLLCWYFGGPVDTYWPNPGMTAGDAPAGRFCLTLVGDGRMILWEFSKLQPGNPPTQDMSDPWRQVDEWQYIPRGHMAGQLHTVFVLPEGNNVLNIFGTGQDRFVKVRSDVFGYDHKTWMTGSGPMTVDVREGIRLPVQVGGMTFPVGDDPDTGGGILYGSPMQFPLPLYTGTVINARVTSIPVSGDTVLTDAAWEMSLVDAATGTDVPVTGPGQYTIAADGNRLFYPRFDFFPSEDQQYSVFLQGWEGSTDLVTQYNSRNVYSTHPEKPQLQGYVVRGPDLETESDNLTAEVLDLDLALETGVPDNGGPAVAGLLTQLDQRVRLEFQYDPNDATKWCRAFGGILKGAPADRMGVYWTNPNGSLLAYPDPRWKAWHIQAAGMWDRLSAPWQTIWSPIYNNREADGSIDPVSREPKPRLAVAVVDQILALAGFPHTQRNILGPPDIHGVQSATGGPRLFVSGRSVYEYGIWPGQTIAHVLNYFCETYLGAKLIWDEAAGNDGRWMLAYPPIFSGSYNSILSYRTLPEPPTPGRAVHLLRSYPGNETFVTKYTRRLVKPEANLFIVSTYGGSGDDNGVDGIRAIKETRPEARGPCYTAVGVNWRSTKFEGYPDPPPGHIDELTAGVKASVLVDSAIYGHSVTATNDALRYVCRRRMEAGGYARYWFEFEAPLMLVLDPDPAYAGLPRLPRMYDVVDFAEDTTINPFLITSFTLIDHKDDGGDLYQNSRVEGFWIPTPLSY